MIKTLFMHNIKTGAFEIYSRGNENELLLGGTITDEPMVKAIERAVREAENIAYRQGLIVAHKAISRISYNY